MRRLTLAIAMALPAVHTFGITTGTATTKATHLAIAGPVVARQGTTGADGTGSKAPAAPRSGNSPSGTGSSATMPPPPPSSPDLEPGATLNSTVPLVLAGALALLVAGLIAIGFLRYRRQPDYDAPGPLMDPPRPHEELR